MMDTSMGAMHGPNPLWYVFGTLFAVTVVGGAYLLARGEVTDPDASGRFQDGGPGSPSAVSGASSSDEGRADGPTTPESAPRDRVLDLLPDDERRVLEPVLDAPGITQIELRDRSEFSKSKVSQTVSALEKRGLLYREPQGRTYRVYPSDDLQRQSEP